MLHCVTLTSELSFSCAKENQSQRAVKNSKNRLNAGLLQLKSPWHRTRFDAEIKEQRKAEIHRLGMKQWQSARRPDNPGLN